MRILFSVAALILVLILDSQAVPLAKRDSIMQLLEKREYIAADSLIREIKATDSLDPDYFILCINYYFCRAEQPRIEIRQGGITAESLIALYDNQGNEVGGIVNRPSFNSDTLHIGLQILDSGIAHHPQRLDMRFGKTYTCFEARLYEESADALVKILAHHRSQTSDWQLDRGMPLSKGGDEYVLENVQGYIRDFFDIASPISDSLVTEISQELIETFPNSAYGYVNLSSILRLKKDYDSSLVLLQKAYQIDSSDPIVVINLAMTAEEAGRVEVAVEYFTKLLSIGNVDHQELARSHLEKLGTTK